MSKEKRFKVKKFITHAELQEMRKADPVIDALCKDREEDIINKYGNLFGARSRGFTISIKENKHK